MANMYPQIRKELKINLAHAKQQRRSFGWVKSLPDFLDKYEYSWSTYYPNSKSGNIRMYAPLDRVQINKDIEWFRSRGWEYGKGSEDDSGVTYSFNLQLAEEMDPRSIGVTISYSPWRTGATCKMTVISETKSMIEHVDRVYEVVCKDLPAEAEVINLHSQDNSESEIDNG